MANETFSLVGHSKEIEKSEKEYGQIYNGNCWQLSYEITFYWG